jgi:hypothetical protein
MYRRFFSLFYFARQDGPVPHKLKAQSHRNERKRLRRSHFSTSRLLLFDLCIAPMGESKTFFPLSTKEKDNDNNNGRLECEKVL